MPRRRSAATWSCISEINGETTSVSPRAKSAGSWKHNDFPAPVGRTARTFRPASKGPSTLSWCTRNAAWPNRSASSARARASPPVNVAIAQRKRAPMFSPEPVPRAAPQAFLLGTFTPAPGPSHVDHGLLLFLGSAFPHQHEDCRLRGDQILRSFERDLDGSLAEEQRVVPDPRLHRQVLDVGAADLPGLVVHAGRLGHRRARPRGGDPAAPYPSAVGRGRGRGGAGA